MTGITEEQLAEWEEEYSHILSRWAEKCVPLLIAEVRRLRAEVQITEDLYRSAHTKYQRCAKALEFYAKPIHWMGPTEDAEIQNVLVAMQGEDPNGWGPAKEALDK